ncbi:MAG: hypothetical protein II376_02665, partial [Clostridia bacterium]|nr:hypothetical protein [Clostridia bacterium]
MLPWECRASARALNEGIWLSSNSLGVGEKVRTGDTSPIFLTHLFPGSRRLFEVADSISEIKTICTCGKKAIINAR